MRLADFIRHDMEAIVAQWEAFAATLLPAAAGLESLALRDHAPDILAAVARDLDTPQTRQEQSDKSKGRAPKPVDATETAAQTHAVLRARGGFDINQLVAEYRALRASVLRLWMDAHAGGPERIDDLIRFNEAIDQAVAESVGHFQRQVEQARNLLLGTLAHDMRSPLSTILMTANYLKALNAGQPISTAAARLIGSGRAMQALLDDLVDFNRTNLGLGIRVTPADIDLAAVVAAEVEQLRGAHPDRHIGLEVSGDCRGRWDGSRLQQSLRNLVMNAIQHGAPGSPVRVALRGLGAQVRLSVTNTGGGIDPAAVDAMFDPLRQGLAEGQATEAGSLGLGLYIVREVTLAHEGEVEVVAASNETTFAIRLPRRLPPGS